ncbi:MAG: hypothetical protein AABX39_00925 [Nanoarchaeota archaeon]
MKKENKLGGEKMDNKKILNQFKRINKALNSQKEILDELLKKNNKDCFYFQPIH